MVSSAVKEAISGVFANMKPMMESIALTPEKLAKAEELRRAPDPAKVAREARERALMKEDIDEARRNVARAQKNCTHKDLNQKYSISLIHNYPDRQTRGVCTHCHLMLEPTHWTIEAPDPQRPRGKPVLVAEHPLYHLVRELEATGS
jgi:hypothetical protein